MEERIKEILEKIKRTAEIVLQHHTSSAFNNRILTLGVESIISMSKEAIAEIEKEKAPKPPG
jgi:uncharacterized protein YutE (UPF0331/DUF86 family)